MHEREEIQIRNYLRLWRERQGLAGLVLMLLLIPTCVMVCGYLFHPSNLLMWSMLLLFGLVMVNIVHLFRTAARVVELKSLLEHSEVIDAEVVSGWSTHA